MKGGEGDTAEDSWQRRLGRKEKKVSRRDSGAAVTAVVETGRGSSDPPSPSGEAQNVRRYVFSNLELERIFSNF